MVKATAMYLVIIIALVIGLLCSSLIVAAYYYRLTYQKKFRYDQLENNVNSGVNIVLGAADSSYMTGTPLSLFNDGEDSVSVKKIAWGLYDIGVSEAFIQKDTMHKVFSMANTLDSSKWAALYLIDEDRPLSLSFKTSIIGDVFIPKAGITTAYVDNKAYEGDKRLVIGVKKNSQRILPILSEIRLNQFQKLFQVIPGADTTSFITDSLDQSFLQATRYFNFKKKVHKLTHVKLSGNIVLLSDTTVIIDSTAKLNNIIIRARAISVKTGFHGTCQLFAADSISVDSNYYFDYPSCLGLMRFGKAPLAASQEKIRLSNNCLFQGVVFTYEKNETALKPTITIGMHTKVTGQIYSQGGVRTNLFAEIDGSMFTSQILYQNAVTLFQNYLIGITINSKALSGHYLTSDLLPVAAKKKKVLQWLETN